MKKLKNIVWIIPLIIAILCIVVGIYLIFLKKDESNKIVNNSGYQSYTCIKGPKKYSGPMNDTDFMTSYEEVQKYLFTVVENQIISSSYLLDYSFNSKEDYDNFLLGKNKNFKAEETLNEDTLEISYSSYMFFPNKDKKDGKEYTESYLNQMMERGFICTLDKKEQEPIKK